MNRQANSSAKNQSRNRASTDRAMHDRYVHHAISQTEFDLVMHQAARGESLSFVGNLLMSDLEVAYQINRLTDLLSVNGTISGIAESLSLWFVAFDKEPEHGESYEPILWAVIQDPDLTLASGDSEFDLYSVLWELADMLQAIDSPFTFVHTFSTDSGSEYLNLFVIPSDMDDNDSRIMAIDALSC